MLTRVQINKSINDKIKVEFPGILIQSRDVEEGFQRPSFFVSLETVRTEAFQFNVLREMTCRILFFPTDRYVFKEEAYDVMDRLEKLFGLNFTVSNRVITIDSAETDIIDKVVHYDFHFSYLEDTQKDETGDLMQELDYNG
jgi:hypothetical protein